MRDPKRMLLRRQEQMRCDAATESSPEPEAASTECLCDEYGKDLCAIHNVQPEAAPEAQGPAVPERDYSEQAERDAEKLAEGYYSPHRLGDGPAWYAACVTACREIASLREKLAQAERKGWNEDFRVPRTPLALSTGDWDVGAEPPCCGNCGHPYHVGKGTEQCPVCLKESETTGRIADVCAAYCPEAASVFETPSLATARNAIAPRIDKDCGVTLYNPVFDVLFKCPNSKVEPKYIYVENPYPTHWMNTPMVYPPQTDAASASEAQSGTSALYVTKAAYDARLAELVQLRAIVAILDAQEVELPELKPYRGWLSDATRERELQLLDALRAVQAWRGVALQLRILFNDGARIEEDGWPVGTDAAIAAYDALAGEGE